MTQQYYHWSPRSRAKQIVKQGLMPGKWSRDRLWKPPYVCLSLDPITAWSLSGEMDRHILRGQLLVGWDPRVHGVYDLWQVDLREQDGFEELFYDTGRVKEVRVYERIYKRNVKWLAGRSI